MSLLARLLPVLPRLGPVLGSAAWHDAVSGHFHIYADADPTLLSTYAGQLERFDSAVRALRSLPTDGDDANKLTIYGPHGGDGAEAARRAVAVLEGGRRGGPEQAVADALKPVEATKT